MSWSSPTSSDPPPPASSSLQVCPNHILTLLSTQLTLLFQPALHRSPLSPHPIQDAVLGPQTENRLLCHLPHQSLQLIPTPNQYLTVLDLWGVLSLSLHTGPSVPEPGSSVPAHRRKVEDGSCHSLLLLQRAPMPCVFPSPQWVQFSSVQSLSRIRLFATP